MKIARAAFRGSTYLARVDGDAVHLLVEQSPLPTADPLREALAAGVDLARAGKEVPLADVRLLAPVANPSKILAIGLNYADHARESGVEPPSSPVVFAKAPSSVIGPDDVVAWSPEASTEVDYEVELAVVIGREAVGAVDDPLGHVFGYTICNDVSARDAQFADGQWIRGKSFDTFCPLGPWIVTADEVPDPQALRLACDVNGERLQDGTTADMIFGVAEIVRYLARFIRLLPGDVIATGTPAGVGFGRRPPRYLQAGDTVTTWVEGIGQLTNTCAAR